MDIATTLQQIGRGNLMAISGFRHNLDINNVLWLPGDHGYHVTVTLEPDDTYTVRRIFKRGNKTWTRGEARDIYPDMLGETCYRASCYHDEWEGL